jgi:hypothetical protein
MVLLFARAKGSESYVRYLLPLLAPLHKLLRTPVCINRGRVFRKNTQT